MRLIPRHRPNRKPTGTPPVRHPVDPLAHLLPDDYEPEAVESNDIHIPLYVDGVKVDDVLIKGGNIFAPSPGSRREAEVDPETAHAEGMRALAEAWHGDKS